LLGRDAGGVFDRGSGLAELGVRTVVVICLRLGFLTAMEYSCRGVLRGTLARRRRVTILSRARTGQMLLSPEEMWVTFSPLTQFFWSVYVRDTGRHPVRGALVPVPSFKILVPRRETERVLADLSVKDTSERRKGELRPESALEVHTTSPGRFMKKKPTTARSRAWTWQAVGREGAKRARMIVVLQG